MRRGLQLLLLLVLFSAAAPASGQTPIVRISATPEEVPVGEPVALEVTVLVPTWFPKPPVYPPFELTNTISRLPPDSSYPTSERVGRDTWSGIVRNYQIYPLVGATYRLSGQTMTVTYTDPETYKPVTVEVAVPEFEFRARVPAGAEGLNPYLSGRRLTLTRDIEGQTESLEAGDAIVVRYTAELDGLPAVFLPPLATELQIEGVSVYADEPVVEDGKPARRTEKLTFVFEAGGDVVVPGIRLDWWNTETGAVDTAAVPDLFLSVVGPEPETGELAAPAERDWRTPAVTIVTAAMLLLFLWRWLPAAAERRRSAAEARKRSEGYAFDLLRRSIRGDDPRAIHRALMIWLERLQPGLDARRFAGDHGDVSLQEKVESLSAAIYAGAEGAFDARGFDKSLAAARRRFLRMDELDARPVLPRLNP